ncbi:hypothetical protein AAC387_Pa08g0611 [Persea americana]
MVAGDGGVVGSGGPVGFGRVSRVGGEGWLIWVGLGTGSRGGEKETRGGGGGGGGGVVWEGFKGGRGGVADLGGAGNWQQGR